MIPKNCIKKFKKTYNVYPSIFEFNDITINSDIEKYFSKFNVLWRHETFTSYGELFVEHKLLDYDSTGVMVYIYGNKHIFILSTESKINVVKLTRQNLKKYGNNI